MSEPRDRLLVRAADGVEREVQVVPTMAGPMENALRTLSKEIARLSERAASGQLSIDDAEKLGLYVRSLRQLRELQKDLAKDTDLGKMNSDQLLQLTVQVLLRRLDEEQLRALGQAVLDRLKNISTKEESKDDKSGNSKKD